MLFDTDILIWLFRGNVKASRIIELDSDRQVSIVTYMELLQGARNRGEVKNIKSFLSDWNTKVVPVSENIGYRASIYMEEYGLKIALGPADALIAATAVENNLVLCSGNIKHYRLIKDLKTKPFRP